MGCLAHFGAMGKILAGKQVLMAERKGQHLGKDAKATKGRGVCKLGWHPTGGEIFLFFKTRKSCHPHG